MAAALIWDSIDVMPALGRLLGVGKEAEVFEWGANVLKLFKSTTPKYSAFREATALALAEALELPAPAVFGVRRVEDRWGVVMARAEGRAFADVLAEQPELAAVYLKEMASLHARIHGCSSINLASLRARLEANIHRVAPILGEVRQRGLLAGLAAMPDGKQLCHGDFHVLNILGSPGRALVVDWLNASSGMPAADVCRSYVLMRSIVPDRAADYVAAYSEIAGRAPDEIFRWLPFVAAARIAEGVPDEVDELIAMIDSGAP